MDKLKPLPRLITFKMNFIDMRIFFNTAYSVSNNNRLFSGCTFLHFVSEIKFKMAFIWAVIT